MAWKLDRLSRSLRELLHLLERIEAAGAGFRSPTESIDTTTAVGRMLMRMLRSFAEYERAMVKERTAPDSPRRLPKAGSAAVGRRPKLTAQQRADIVENVRSGRRTAVRMARLYGVSGPTISRIPAVERVLPTNRASTGCGAPSSGLAPSCPRLRMAPSSASMRCGAGPIMST